MKIILEVKKKNDAEDGTFIEDEPSPNLNPYIREETGLAILRNFLPAHTHYVRASTRLCDLGSRSIESSSFIKFW